MHSLPSSLNTTSLRTPLRQRTTNRLVRTAGLCAVIMSMVAMTGCDDQRFTVGEQTAFVLDMVPGTAVTISTPYGDVDIAPTGEELPDWVGNDGGTGTINVNEQQTVVIAWVRSTSQERLDQVVLTPVLADGKLTLSTQWPQSNQKNKDAVYFSVRTPHELGSVTIATDYGDVEVEQRHAAATIRTGYGDVELEDSQGSVLVNTGYGDVDIENAADSLTIKSGYGDIDVELSHAHAALTLNSGYGDIQVESPTPFSGTLNLKTGYGKINAVNTSGKIINQKGAVILAGDNTAPVWVINTGYGDIVVTTPTP
jgi:hypothetical protein